MHPTRPELPTLDDQEPRPDPSRLAACLGALGATALELDAEGRCTGAWGGALPGRGSAAAAARGATCEALLGPVIAADLARARRGERVEHDWRAPDPGGRVCRVALGPVPGGDAVVAVVREVTAQRWEDARAILTGRMASIGTLAGGVAHGINNPLATIVANLEFAQRELGRRRGDGGIAAADAAGLADLDEALVDARVAADRIRAMVRDLQRFSSSREPGGGLVDVNRAIDASLMVAWPDIKHRARLVKELGAVPPVDADEAHLRQVFLNLVMNAAEAITEGNAERNLIRVRTATDPAGHAVIEIRDTGSGVPPEALPHIFDPFFTTKPVGAGAGVGLALCHSIVAAAGGHVAVESEVGRGALFRVVLPAAVAAPGRAPPPGPAPLAGARARILVIDDEAPIGAAIRRALAPYHDVVTTTQATDALARIAAGERFDLIICDLLMPEVSGADLYHRLRRDAPALAERIVFLTGGAFTARARELLDSVPNARLEKPFELKNLLAVVERALR